MIASTLACGLARRSATFLRPSSRSVHGMAVGIVGIGKIGGGILSNFVNAGIQVYAYDSDSKAMAAAKAIKGVVPVGSVAEVARDCDVVFSVLPNDKVLKTVSEDLLTAFVEHTAIQAAEPSAHVTSSREPSVHVSCSTVDPETSREMSLMHSSQGVGFVAAPFFARPDGIRRGEATVPFSGPTWAKDRVRCILEKTATRVEDFGEDPGVASVVKLGGNFLIAAAIESLAEASALAESHGVDREKFISLMSSTIFDCLIYRGYGHRVGARDHHPYPDNHFQLDLGEKDLQLINKAAGDVKCPMPVAALVHDRLVASQHAGRGHLDWSSLALRVSEDAGNKSVQAAIVELMKHHT